MSIDPRVYRGVWTKATLLSVTKELLFSLDNVLLFLFLYLKLKLIFQYTLEHITVNVPVIRSIILGVICQLRLIHFLLIITLLLAKHVHIIRARRHNMFLIKIFDCNIQRCYETITNICRLHHNIMF